MPATSNDELDRINLCLNILDGLTKAFENLDKMFDELIASGEKQPEDSECYVKHSELLENLHAIVVKDLTALRNDLVCQCDDNDDSDLLVEHQDDDTEHQYQ